MHQNSDRKIYLLIFFTWVTVHIILFIKNGIVDTGEAEKYIFQADRLINTGRLASTNFWLYSTQIFLIAADRIFNTGYIFAITVQLTLSAGAVFSFYRLCTMLASRKAALFCTILLLINYPYLEFNFFLQTESVFYSLSIIFTGYLFKIKRLTAGTLAITISLLFLLSVTRPTGILFFIPAGVFILLEFRNQIKRSYILASIGLLFLFLSLLNSAINSGGELDFMLPYLREHVICGVPNLPSNANIKLVENSNSLPGIIYYVTHNFGQFARLAVLKAGAFFGLTRTYFSNAHNIYLVSFFYPIYLMFLLSIKHWIRKSASRFFYLITTISIALITTMLTCDDWHNRFFLGISPFLIILTLPAIRRLTS